MMRGLARSLTVGFGILALSAGSASAAVIDFSTGSGGAGGTIVFGGGDVIGTNIPIDMLDFSSDSGAESLYDVEGVHTGSHFGCENGVHPETCGWLNFDRNAGTISIIGYVDGLGQQGANMVLLSGDFSGYFNVTTDAFGNPVGISAAGNDSKNPDLLRALGMNPNTGFAYFGFSLGVNCNGDGDTRTCVGRSTDIVNTSVPEPGSLALLGTGLFGLAGAIRRKMSK